MLITPSVPQYPHWVREFIIVPTPQGFRSEAGVNTCRNNLSCALLPSAPVFKVLHFQVGTLKTKDSPDPYQKHPQSPWALCYSSRVLPPTHPQTVPELMEMAPLRYPIGCDSACPGKTTFSHTKLPPFHVTRAPTQPCRSLTSWLFPSEKLGTHSTNWDMAST